MSLPKITMVTVFTLSVVFQTADAGAQKIYWTNWTEKKIQAANLNGSNVQDLVSTEFEPYGIAVDPLGGKIYWTEGTGLIRRANLDGSTPETLLSTFRPWEIALDLTAGKMYWTFGFDYTNGIARANLDGSGIEEKLVFTSDADTEGIALGDGKVYWTQPGEDMIRRANLDGSGVETIVETGLEWPSGIAVDPIQRKLYWCDLLNSKIQRSNLDGGEIEEITIAGLKYPSSIALDSKEGKIYWAEVAAGGPGPRRLRRADVDGSDAEDLVTTGFHGLYVDLDVSQPPFGNRSWEVWVLGFWGSS